MNPSDHLSHEDACDDLDELTVTSYDAKLSPAMLEYTDSRLRALSERSLEVYWRRLDDDEDERYVSVSCNRSLSRAALVNYCVVRF